MSRSALLALCLLGVAAVLVATVSARVRSTRPDEVRAPGEAMGADRVAPQGNYGRRPVLGAAVTFDRLLTFKETHDFLEEHDLRPFAVHLWIMGADFVPSVRPEDATEALLELARGETFDRALDTLCDPDAIDLELDLNPGTAMTEGIARAMLTRLEISRLTLAEVWSDSPMLFGVKVVGGPPDLERLESMPSVRGVELWGWVDAEGVERFTGLEPEMPGSISTPTGVGWIEELETAALPTELERAVSVQPVECRMWRERRLELR